MKIIERIFQIMEQKQKRATDLCDILQIRTSTMSTWKTRGNDPPAKYMKAISDFLDVSLDYLLTGVEASVPKSTSSDEDDLLELYRLLPNSKKFEFKGEIKGYLKALEETQKYLDEKKRLSV